MEDSMLSLSGTHSFLIDDPRPDSILPLCQIQVACYPRLLGHVLTASKEAGGTPTL